MDTNFQEVSLKVERDKLELLFNHSRPAAYFALLNGVLVVFLLYGKLSSLILFAWFLWLTLTFIIRTLFYKKYSAINKSDGFQLKAWERGYFITLMLSASVWGVGGVILGMNIPVNAQYWIHFFLMGMAGAGISVYSAKRYVALTTVWSILFPYTLWTLVQGEPEQKMLAVAALTFLVASLRATKVSSQALHDALTLTYEIEVAKDLAEQRARTDFLTGLYNRLAFFELAEAQEKISIRYGQTFSIIAIDIDNFKIVNDTYGHAIGDVAITVIASTMKNALRTSDICCRFGGEEFIIFLPNTDKSQAISVAEKLRKSIENQSIEHKGGNLTITASFGVCASSDGHDLEKMLVDADKALYEAKRTGRNKVVPFDEKVALGAMG